MGRLRYYLGACLILILTHSASAAVTDALSQAGFTCLAASDSSGAPFGGTMCTHEAMSTSAFTLDEAVAVYVPSTTSVVVRHIVLYLQGFRGVCGDTGTTPADVMNVFDLAEQMQAESPPDSVLVFPMSGGHDTTYYHDFAASAGPFAEFMNWIETVVGQGQWSLAPRGGGRPTVMTHRRDFAVRFASARGKSFFLPAPPSWDRLSQTRSRSEPIWYQDRAKPRSRYQRRIALIDHSRTLYRDLRCLRWTVRAPPRLPTICREYGLWRTNQVLHLMNGSSCWKV